jgi:hypothetical protein
VRLQTECGVAVDALNVEMSRGRNRQWPVVCGDETTSGMSVVVLEIKSS